MYFKCHAYWNYCVTCAGFPTHKSMRCHLLRAGREQTGEPTHANTQDYMKYRVVVECTPLNREKCFLNKRSLLVILLQNIYLSSFMFSFCVRDFKGAQVCYKDGAYTEALCYINFNGRAILKMKNRLFPLGQYKLYSSATLLIYVNWGINKIPCLTPLAHARSNPFREPASFQWLPSMKRLRNTRKDTALHSCQHSLPRSHPDSDSNLAPLPFFFFISKYDLLPFSKML